MIQGNLTRLISGILIACCLIPSFSSCRNNGTEHPHVAGTWEGPLSPDAAPARVLQAIQQADSLSRYEILSDTLNGVSVSGIGEADSTPTDGFGIIVVKGTTSTTFPQIRHTRQPIARYNSKTGDLWLTGSAAEGTGIQVEWLYRIRFDSNDSAHLTHVIDPYELQQQLCSRLGYQIEGEKVTFFDGRKEIASTTETVSDMGGFDDGHPLWIGEQMQYDLSGPAPCLLVTPGVKFITGLVLTYDDMPTLSAPVSIADDGQVSICDLSPVEHPYEGIFLDEDNDEPNLSIHYRRNDGRYDVQLGIFRLTYLDDGIGTMDGTGLSFTATDAAGNPITGLITLQGDIATVTFTDSTWSLLETGSQFRYHRHSNE